MTFDTEQIMNRQGWKYNASLAGKDLDNFNTDHQGCDSRLAFALEYSGENVFMYGQPGRGKTHLARGIMKSWIQDGQKAIYWPLMQLLGDLRGRMKGGRDRRPDAQIDWLCDYQGLLIIDELGRSKGDVWDRDTVVYQLIDRRQHLPSIWISNYGTNQLSKIYDEAIASRLSASKLIPFPESMEDFRGLR